MYPTVTRLFYSYIKRAGVHALLSSTKYNIMMIHLNGWIDYAEIIES